MSRRRRHVVACCCCLRSATNLYLQLTDFHNWVKKTWSNMNKHCKKWQLLWCRQFDETGECRFDSCSLESGCSKSCPSNLELNVLVVYNKEFSMSLSTIVSKCTQTILSWGQHCDLFYLNFIIFSLVVEFYEIGLVCPVSSTLPDKISLTVYALILIQNYL